MNNRGGFVLIFVLLTVTVLASLIAFLRLKGFQEAKFSQLVKTEREVALSWPGWAAYCRQKALEIENNPSGSSSAQDVILKAQEDLLEIDCSLPSIILKARFTPENSRLNLNQPDAETLEALLTEAGFSLEQAQIMTQSLLDWIDKDNEHHFLGAEKDYYEPLGYAPRNGPLVTLDEVVLIRGFDAYLFWISPGLYDLFTLYAQGGTNKPVLKASQDKGMAGGEGGLSLKVPGVYREELEIEYLGRKWRYLDIFSTANGEPQVLYRHVLSSFQQEEK